MKEINGLVCKKGLPSEVLEQIIELAKLCERHDNIDLETSLGLPMLKERREDQINDFVYYYNGLLVGYLGMLAIVREDEVEISGMVHPEYRNRGIFRTMANALNEECKKRSVRHKLFVVNRASASGKAAVEKFGGTYHFAEYTMDFDINSNMQLNHDDRVILSPSLKEHIPKLVQIGARAFGNDEALMTSLMNRNFSNSRYQTYIAAFEDEEIGMITVSDEDGIASISGFSVLPEYQGKGIGRQILYRTVQSLIKSNKKVISLDVQTGNLNALGLYESCGFKVRSGFEYYVHK